MHRILLISPFDGHKQEAPSLGIGYIKAYSDNKSNNLVEIHDENFIVDLDAALFLKINEFKPHFIGITFPSSAVLRISHITKIVKQKWPQISIFAGGYHPTSEPELTLRLIPHLDFVMIGEAENSVAGLNLDWKGLDNVAYLNENGVYIENKIGKLEDINCIPYPDRKLIDKRYFQPQKGVITGIWGKTATIMSSRGCPYSCNFCSSKLIQKRVRYHSTEYVLKEIEHILTTVGEIDYLFFLDVMFLTKWQRVEDLCYALKKEKHHKRFKWAATVSANVVDDAKLKLMKESGCFYLCFGFESNSAKVLDLINKKSTPEHNKKAVDICKANGIYSHSAFLFGIPEEEEEDLIKTVEFVKENNVSFTGVNIMKPLPGSPFYYSFVKNGDIVPSIEEWHKVSSINVPSRIYNNKISEEQYKHYIKQFYKAIKIKGIWNNITANWKLRLKYINNNSLIRS